MDLLALITGRKRKYDDQRMSLSNHFYRTFSSLFPWLSSLLLLFFCCDYGLLRLFTRIRRNARNYQKLHRVLSMMSFFGLREWKFCNKNIDQLGTLLKSQSARQQQTHNVSTDLIRWQNGVNSMPSKNGTIKGNYTTHNKFNRNAQTLLEFDMRTIDWNEYFFHYLPGIKKFFFKESIDDKKCIKRYGRYVLMLLALLFSPPSMSQRLTNSYWFLIFRLKILHILFKSSAYMLFLFLTSSVVFKYIIKLLLC